MRPHCGQTTCRPLVPWVRTHVQTVPVWLHALPSPTLFLPSWLGVQGLGDLSQMEHWQEVEASVSATSWRGRLGSPLPCAAHGIRSGVCPVAQGQSCPLLSSQEGGREEWGWYSNNLSC